MDSIASFYDNSGKLVLSKNDLALVNDIPYRLLPNNNATSNTYFEWQENITFADAETNAAIAGNWWVPKTSAWTITDINAPIWFGLNDLASVFLIDKNLKQAYAGIYLLSFGISPTGGGVKMMPVQKKNLNQYSGYFDVYSEQGDLQWSVQSIIQAPKILTVVNIPPTATMQTSSVSIDLAQFNVDVNKCFMLATCAGRISLDGTFFDYFGVSVKRKGTKLFFRPYYSSKINYTVGQMFGEAGINIPIAYMPNT